MARNFLLTTGRWTDSHKFYGRTASATLADLKLNWITLTEESEKLIINVVFHRQQFDLHRNRAMTPKIFSLRRLNISINNLNKGEPVTHFNHKSRSAKILSLLHQCKKCCPIFHMITLKTWKVFFDLWWMVYGSVNFTTISQWSLFSADKSNSFALKHAICWKIAKISLKNQLAIKFYFKVFFKNEVKISFRMIFVFFSQIINRYDMDARDRMAHHEQLRLRGC